MFNPVSTQDPGLNVRSQPENVSLIEKQRPTLVKLLGEDNMQRAKELAKDTFDPKLWRMLNSSGPAKYHWIVAKDELQPGYLWVQEDMLSNIAIHWSTEPGWIHRAYPSKEKEDTVVVESYMAHQINIRITSQEASIEGFQSLVKYYLSKSTNPSEVICQSQFARKFQRQLEHFPIVFKITQSACEKLAQLRKNYSSSVIDMSVVLGVNGREGEKFNPIEGRGVQLVEISKYFINGRLPFLHEMDGKPEMTTEPVAPVFRTMDAFMQVFNLRTMVPEGHVDDAVIFHLDPERLVGRILSDDVIEGRGLKDLHAWFVLVPGGFRVEPHEFEELEAGTSEKESLELSIDFKEDVWKLQSQFFKRV